MAVRHDFVMEVGAKFYKEFALNLADNNVESLVGFRIQGVIKESLETTTPMFTLTEANGGIVILDDPSGTFAMSIDADAVAAAHLAAGKPVAGWYVIEKVDENYPTQETQRLLQGRITFDIG